MENEQTNVGVIDLGDAPRSSNSAKPRHYVIFDHNAGEWAQMTEFFGTQSPATMTKILLALTSGKGVRIAGKVFTLKRA